MIEICTKPAIEEPSTFKAKRTRLVRLPHRSAWGETALLQRLSLARLVHGPCSPPRSGRVRLAQMD